MEFAPIFDVNTLKNEIDMDKVVDISTFINDLINAEKLVIEYIENDDNKIALTELLELNLNESQTKLYYFLSTLGTIANYHSTNNNASKFNTKIIDIINLFTNDIERYVMQSKTIIDDITAKIDYIRDYYNELHTLADDDFDTLRDLVGRLEDEDVDVVEYVEFKRVELRNEMSLMEMIDTMTTNINNQPINKLITRYNTHMVNEPFCCKERRRYLHEIAELSIYYHDKIDTLTNDKNYDSLNINANILIDTYLNRIGYIVNEFHLYDAFKHNKCIIQHMIDHNIISYREGFFNPDNVCDLRYSKIFNYETDDDLSANMFECNELSDIIKRDDVSEFVTYVTTNNIDLNDRYCLTLDVIEEVVRKTNRPLYTNLSDYALYHGSSSIYNYIMNVTKGKFIYKNDKYILAIHGGNPMLYHYLEDNKYEHYVNEVGLIKHCIVYHHHDMLKYIIDNMSYELTLNDINELHKLAHLFNNLTAAFELFPVKISNDHHNVYYPYIFNIFVDIFEHDEQIKHVDLFEKIEVIPIVNNRYPQEYKQQHTCTMKYSYVTNTIYY